MYKAVIPMNERNKEILDRLSDEQAGKLIKALFECCMYGNIPRFSADSLLAMAFDAVDIRRQEE